MYCKGVSSNIQTQFNTITSNSIFSGIFNIICTFNSNVFFTANATFNGAYAYFNGIAEFLNSVNFSSSANVNGDVNLMLEACKINFNQATPATEINSTMYYNSTTGLNVENLNTSGGLNVRLNSGSDIVLKASNNIYLNPTGNTILSKCNMSLSSVYNCNTL